MFERQTPQPFPARNIAFLAAIVLGMLVFLIKSVQPKLAAPPPDHSYLPDTNSNRIEVPIDSLAR